MDILPFVREGLGNSSYLVATGDGTALLIDPDRTAQRYFDAAHERGWRIEAVLETHLHADFVSGAREVAAACGATLFVPRDADSAFEHRAVAPGERLTLHGMDVEVIASPGHTPEHVAYVARSARGPASLFSGGSLIVGGAARTDLIAPEMTDELTHAQYRTLRTAFAALGDETLLLPTHGAGSFCSAGSSGDRTSTLGAERAHNQAMRIDDEEAFARWFISTFPAIPAYYARMRPLNQRGPRLRGDIAMPPPLTAGEFDAARAGATVVDLRPGPEYMRAHIPASLSNAIRDAYAVWLGWLVPEDASLLFIAQDAAALARAIDESLLVGYERFAGYLDGGFAAWERAGLPAASAPLDSVAEARAALIAGATPLDVREPDEYRGGHIEDAIAAPLGTLPARVAELRERGPLVVYCGAGERSTTAVSLLERAGVRDARNLAGGLDAWRDAGQPIVTHSGER